MRIDWVCAGQALGACLAQGGARSVCPCYGSHDLPLPNLSGASTSTYISLWNLLNEPLDQKYKLTHFTDQHTKASENQSCSPILGLWAQCFLLQLPRPEGGAVAQAHMDPKARAFCTLTFSTILCLSGQVASSRDELT